MTASASISEALASTRSSLGLPARGDEIDDVLLAHAARRAIYIMAPCTHHSLVRALLTSFQGLGVPDDLLAERLDTVVDQLAAYGDILEMRPAEQDIWRSGDVFVLRPAPPAFVRRKDHSIVILGVGGDSITPLTAEFEARVRFSGVLRILESEGREASTIPLRELGILELSEEAWLRVPPSAGASDYATFWCARLAREASSSPIENLTILGSANAGGRWSKPGAQDTGVFVARRAQRYGADRWCLVDMANGTVTRFLDLASPGDRVRPCDIAWRIKAAFDAVAGRLQQYQMVNCGASSTLFVFGPLPSWVERRLAVVGEKRRGQVGIFGYEMPTTACLAESTFLRENLWMAERESTQEAEYRGNQ